MNDYKKYLLRSMGLKESQFIPSSLLEKDEFPGIDPDELEKGTEDEKDDHGMPIKKAELTAKQHLTQPAQGHYYSGMEKAKKAGMLKDQAMLSPTAIATPVIGLAIRGSSTGGLPSGIDQGRQDISPSKVGGYDRVTPQNLNSTLVDKTPSNPEIHQDTAPINPNPSTEDGVTHPHQIQVTAHEEPQAVTGASTDSDPTLKLKSAMPKGIDIDITEQRTEDEEAAKNNNNNTAMIPATSLSETFQRHIRLMREKIGLTEGKCPCGCEGTCSCPPNCKCKKNRNGVCECSTCGCGKPSDTHGLTENDDDDDDDGGICSTCNGSGEGRADGTRCSSCKGSGVNRPRGAARDEEDPDAKYERWRDKQMGLQEGKHKSGCQCGFCKNKGSFGKKKEVSEDGGGDDPDFKEKDEKQFRKDRSASAEGEEVRKHFDKDKKDAVKEDKLPQVKEPNFAYCVGCGEKMSSDHASSSSTQHKVCDKCKGKEQQRIDESYSAPFQRMRGLAGVGGTFLGSNGLWENKNEPGASKPFNTNWKMDKERAGFVKIDEDKLKRVKAALERKSKRGTLSDKELLLAKRLDEVVKKRQSGLDKQSQKVDGRFAKMEKNPKDRPFPFDRDDYVPGPEGKLVPHKKWSQLASQGKVVTAK